MEISLLPSTCLETVAVNTEQISGVKQPSGKAEVKPAVVNTSALLDIAVHRLLSWNLCNNDYA